MLKWLERILTSDRLFPIIVIGSVTLVLATVLFRAGCVAIEFSRACPHCGQFIYFDEKRQLYYCDRCQQDLTAEPGTTPYLSRQSLYSCTQEALKFQWAPSPSMSRPVTSPRAWKVIGPLSLRGLPSLPRRSSKATRTLSPFLGRPLAVDRADDGGLSVARLEDVGPTGSSCFVDCPCGPGFNSQNWLIRLMRA
jgi:hypothetical protein